MVLTVAQLALLYCSKIQALEHNLNFWNLFWDCRSVAVAPFLDGMSEEQENCMAYTSVLLRMFI